MYGKIDHGEARIEPLRCQVRDFDGMARTGHALAELRCNAVTERFRIGVRDDDESMHTEDSCQPTL